MPTAIPDDRPGPALACRVRPFRGDLNRWLRDLPGVQLEVEGASPEHLYEIEGRLDVQCDNSLLPVAGSRHLRLVHAPGRHRHLGSLFSLAPDADDFAFPFIPMEAGDASTLMVLPGETCTLQVSRCSATDLGPALRAVWRPWPSPSHFQPDRYYQARLSRLRGGA